MSMQVDSGERANQSFGTIDLSTESTSPMDFEQLHRCQSCASLRTGHTQKVARRPANRSRAASGDGDRMSVKLRNSCRSCADSKVRCNKDKPRCSRCDARDLPCEYLQSKRPGRVPGANLRQKQAKQAAEQLTQGSDPIAQDVDNINVNGRDAGMMSPPFRLEDFTQNASGQFGRRATSVYSTSSASHVDGNTAGSSPGDYAEPNGFYTCNAPVAPMATVSTVSNMNDAMDIVDIDSLWPSEDDYSSLIDMDLANFAQVSGSPHALNGISTTTSNQANSAFPSSASSAVHLQDMLGITAPSSGTSMASTIGSSSKNNSPSCTCMIRALELLKSLSSDESPNTSSITAEHYTQQVLQENEGDIDANLAMLACTACSRDRFLLMVLLMNAAKILTRYASVAALCRSCTPSTSSLAEETSSILGHNTQLMDISRAWGGVCMIPPAPKSNCETQTSCWQAVQRVLRELHRLQRLLTQLTIRRESLRAEDENKVATAGTNGGSMGSFMMWNRSGSQMGSRSSASPGGIGLAIPTPHLHDDALSMVEDNVRNGLSVLSAVIRDLLNNS